MRYIVTKLIYLTTEVEADSALKAEDKFEKYFSELTCEDFVDKIVDAQYEFDTQEND